MKQVLLVAAFAVLLMGCNNGGTSQEVTFETICYTSSDGMVVEPCVDSTFGGKIESNTYENGEGKIVVKSTVTTLDEMAFYSCPTLTTITLPDNIKSIGAWAFSDCSSLESVTLSNQTKRIGDNAFSTCVQLKSIHIPDSVESIGETILYGCTSLSTITGKYASADNRCLIVDGILHMFAPAGITAYAIPAEAKAVGMAAFYECISLTEIEIHNAVEAIDDYAFYYCQGLEKVYCKAKTPPTLGECVFDNYDEGDTPIGCKIYVPTESVSAYRNAENWSRYRAYIFGRDFQ